ncbi:MAG: hypothetical protein ABIH35_02340 [Patescibacteria group bacterium]
MNLILSHHRNSKPGIRRRTLSSRVEVGTFTLMVVVIALALAVSLVYLAHANRTATRGYALKKLEIEKNTLQTQMEIWDQQVSEAKSLEAIKESGILEQMQPVSEAQYIKTETLGDE